MLFHDSMGVNPLLVFDISLVSLFIFVFSSVLISFCFNFAVSSFSGLLCFFTKESFNFRLANKKEWSKGASALGYVVPLSQMF